MNQVKVYRDSGDWDVWMNTGIADHDGICLSSGRSRQAAIEEALHSLLIHAETLRRFLYTGSEDE